MQIIVTRLDGAVTVNPAPPYLVDYLQYSHRSFETVNWKRVNKFERRLLFTPLQDGGIVTLPGFFCKIKELIARNQDHILEVEARTPLPSIDLARVKKIGLRDYQVDVVLDFLSKAQHHSGILNATGGYGKTIMQAVTYAAYHNLNTVLAIPLKQVFLQTYEKFVKLFPDKHIGRVGDGHRDISPDITISTFKSLKACSLEKCQLLLVDEIQSTTGDSICDILTGVQPIRAFGYTATDKNLFNGADKLLKGLFGDRLVHIEYQEAQDVNAVVPGLVYFVKMRENSPVRGSSFEAKISSGIKCSDERNKLIGDICAKIPNNWQTIVFVDHVADHLVRLHKNMPVGTKYVHRDASKKSVGAYALTPKQQKETAESFSKNQFQYLIATDAFRAGVDVPNCRVVVQASGGASEVEILQEAFRGSRTLPEDHRAELGVEPKTHFVLIDIMDCHDDKLEAMSLKRKEIYKKQGWKVVDVDSPDQINWFGYEVIPKQL